MTKPSKGKTTWIFQFGLFEIHIYPHPFAKTGWFINLHRNKRRLCDSIRYESRRKGAIALRKMLLDVKVEINKAIKELDGEL